MSNFVNYPPMPGKKHGPCKGTCSHIQCILKRHDAERQCPVCGEVLGWNAEVIFNYRQPTHHACMVSAMQKRVESLDKMQDRSPELNELLFACQNWLAGNLDNEQFNQSFVHSKNRPVVLTAGRISD